MIQILDDLGRTTSTYFWADLPDDEIYGWLDEEDNPAEVIFQPGDGLWIFSADPSFKIQSAGQVPTTDIAVVLRENFKMVVNNTPVAVDIQDIVVSGYEGETAGDVMIQVLDTLGRTTATYFWCDLPEDEIYGWLDEQDNPAEVEITAGEAMWVFAPNSDYVITIPGVSVK